MEKKGSWNAGNPAVKRILKEAKEFTKSPCREFTAEPLEVFHSPFCKCIALLSPKAIA